jgi:hypothetical protein
MSKLFAVAVTRMVHPMTLDEAIQYAKTYRERGYKTQVIPMVEAKMIMAENQQDLTVIAKAWKVD